MTALSLLLLACTGAPTNTSPPDADADADTDTDSDTDTGTSLPDTVTIGADGGAVALEGGGELTIPAGALTEDVEITATVITDLAAAGYPGAPEFTDGARYAIALEPHGLTFAEPATLSLPHGGRADGLAILRVEDAEDTTWQAVQDLVQGDTMASVEISGFSGYALVLVKDGECPCFDAADVVHFFEYGESSGWTASNQSYHAAHDYVTAEFSDSAVNDYTTLSAYDPSRASPPGQPSCTVLAASSSGAAQSLVAAWFSGIAGLDTDPSVARLETASTSAQAQACITLIETGARYELGAPLTVSVTGLGSESLSIEEGLGFLGPWTLTGDATHDLGLYPLTAASPISLEITSVTGSLTCEFVDQTTVGDSGPTYTVFEPDPAGVNLVVTCAPTTTSECDDDLSGTWTSTIDGALFEAVVTGTRSAFSYAVPGGAVTGSVADDGTITAVLDTSAAYASDPGSAYACPDATAETMRFVFTLGDEGAIDYTLTYQP